MEGRQSGGLKQLARCEKQLKQDNGYVIPFLLCMLEDHNKEQKKNQKKNPGELLIIEHS